MKQFTYTINDPLGIHARPAGSLAKLVKSLDGAIVTVTKGDKTAKASQLMKLMSLGIKQGDEITVAVEGVNEEAAIADVEAFFKGNL